MSHPHPKNGLKGDVVFSSRELKHGYWLLELRASMKANVSRWLIIDKDGVWTGEIKRPRYGTRSMEVYSHRNLPYSARFEIKMQSPAAAEEVLVEYAVDFVEKFGG